MKKSLFLIYILLFLPIQIFSQLNGDVSGKVIDKRTKQPLPGANVLVVGTETGTATDSEGKFLIKNLSEDIYKIQISFIGYNTHIETDVRIIRDKTTVLNEVELIETSITGDEVIVSANLFEENDLAPVSNYTYSKDEIYRSPGAAGDVFRAIETLPGVSSSGGEFSAFSVRGGSPKENIILVDNIPFDKVSHFNGGSSEEQESQGGRFSIFAPNLIEEANFQAGGFSPIYGGKFSSYLDLKIKDGNTENAIYDGRIDVIGWEFNYNGPTQIFDNSSMVLSARRSNFTQILDLTGQKEFGEPRFNDFISKFTFNINPTNKVSLLAIYSPEEFDRTAEHVLESDDFAGTDITDFEETKYLLGLNWRVLTGQKSYLQNAFYYRRTDREGIQGRAYPIFRNGNPPASEDDFFERNRLKEDNSEFEVGLRSLFSYSPTKRITLNTGFEVNRINFDNNRTLFGNDTLFVFDEFDFRPDQNQNFVIVTPENFDSKFNESKSTAALFSELSIRLSDKFTVNPGLRYEYNEFNKENYFAPRFSATYKVSENTRLNFATGIFYQNPELSILTFAEENNNLENEKAIHAIAGITHYLSDDLKFTGEGYYKEFDNLIVRNDRATQIRTNDGDGWARGVDISLVKRFVDKFYGQMNYSYAQSKRNDNNGGGEYNSDFNQPHVFNILFGYEFNKEWSISAKWKYATGRPKDSYIVYRNIFDDENFLRYSKEITANNGDRLSDFHTLNIRVDYRKQFGKFAVVSFLDIVNIYNYLNVNEERFQELNGEFDERGFGILPTLGIKLEF